MEDNNTTPETNSNSPKTAITGLLGKLNRKTLIAVLGVVVIVVAAIGTYLYKDNSEPPPPTTRDHSFDDQESEIGRSFFMHHLLQGDNNGTSMEIDIPWDEFQYADGPADGSDPRLAKSSADEQFVNKGNLLIMGQRVYSASDGSMYQQAIIAARIFPKDQLASLNSGDYFRQLISGYVFGTGTEDASKVVLGLKQPVEFTNANVKKGAQVYEIEALPSGEAPSPVGHIKGQLIEVVGKNANYYVLIAAIDTVWDSSPNSWQKVRDSIKIDL